MTILRHKNDDLELAADGKATSPNYSVDGVSIARESHGTRNLGSPRDCAGQGRLSLSNNFTLETPRNWLAHLYCKKVSNGRLPWNPSQMIVATCLLGASSSFVCAVPIQSAADSSSSAELHWLHRRSISVTFWIPVVAICGFTVLLAAWTCWRRRRAVASLLRHRAIVINPENGERELTADELTGSINTAGTGTESQISNDNSSAPRTRRNRRARRTPSQISTRSLPEYAKEPGAQELVVLRRKDKEGDPISQTLAAVIQLDVDESDTSGSRPVSRYTQVPDTPAHSPLLQDYPADDPSPHPDQDTDADAHRRSGSAGNRNETTPLDRDSHDLDPLLNPRREAPPYFEVIERPGTGGSGVVRGIIDAGPHNAPPSPVPSEGASPPASPRPGSSHSNLRPGSSHSNFRTMLNRMSPAGSPTHFRNTSSISVISSSHSHYRSHHHGPSTSSILSTFRPLTRQRSMMSHNGSRPNLTSPSQVSVNSISAPLTHTAVRTEFSYPKRGPTPDQMRLIASVETVKRFGVPYGPDAVAFSSLSRVNLADGDRPPEFESVTGGDRIGDEGSTSAAGGQSRTSGGVGGPQEDMAADVNNQSPGEGSTPPVNNLPVENALALNVEGGLSADAGPLPEGVTGLGQGGEGANAKDATREATYQVKGKGKATETVALEDTVLSTSQAIHECGIYRGPTVVDLTPSMSGSRATISSHRARTHLSGTYSVPVRPRTAPAQTMAWSSGSATPGTSSNHSSLPKPYSPRSRARPSSPPSSYCPPKLSSLHPEGELPQRERSESRASQVSYASHTSNASNGTFCTAAESLRSRRNGQRPNMTDDEDDDAFGYNTADDGTITEVEEDSRPSTPTPGGDMAPVSQRRESTDSTVGNLTSLPAGAMLDRHMSTATITPALSLAQ